VKASEHKKRSAAFTLIEVMVAVAILAFTATAALRLVILAQDGLIEAKKRQKLLEEACFLQTEIRLGRAEASGGSGDIEWSTAEKKADFFGEDFGRLDFDESGDVKSRTAGEAVAWRELTVRRKDGSKIVLCLPAQTDDSGKGGTETQEGSKNTDKNKSQLLSYKNFIQV
jgi:prepilin-type N-terminal cleavage/methylation domain-containing protein